MMQNLEQMDFGIFKSFHPGQIQGLPALEGATSGLGGCSFFAYFLDFRKKILERRWKQQKRKEKRVVG